MDEIEDDYLDRDLSDHPAIRKAARGRILAAIDQYRRR